MNKNVKVILSYILVFAVIILIGTNFMNLFENEDEITYSDILEYFKTEQVKSFTVTDSNELILTLHEEVTLPNGKTVNKQVTTVLRDLGMFYEDTHELAEAQRESGILEEYHYQPLQSLPWWVSFLPYLIMMVIMIGLWIYMSRQMSGQGGKMSSFGRARVKMGSDEKKRITFADVAGADEEKEELEEVVEFLKNPKEFEKLGAKIPHGVLLMGPPGTGKTLLAKAVAGEANVPFYSISGSDFVEMYVGVGASRVRDLFETARRHPASIVFIDEIDAVGRQRGTGLGGGHDEREQTLNQLLVEMDGFGNGSNIIVIAATNRADILDPALLRPGRFDRQITVNYPDIQGREAILKVHAKGKPFESDVSFNTIAKSTVGFTGADLANLLNEAALLAARRKKSLIGMNDIEDAMMKVLMGPQKRSKRISDKDKKITAYHEAGHAIASKIVCPGESVHQISIIPAGRAAGVTVTLPKEDLNHLTKNEMESRIVMLLGGRCAEALIMGDVSTGASNDIERATSLARNMVTRYGMSDKLGPIVYGNDHDSVFLGRDFSSSQSYSDKTAYDIDEEIQRIVKGAYAKVESILKENMDKLHFIAGFLFKNEVMEEDQFEAAMARENPTVDEIEALKSERAKRSEFENAEAKKRRDAEEEEKRKQADEDAAKRVDEISPEGPTNTDDPPKPKD
ncbi:MAG: ATP-dependent zinc metalloprotease FtsH [Clostridia bacterium]|nr:ATP-dependent zinc metalloprotease FtsH [Clostridia bacterium]